MMQKPTPSTKRLSLGPLLWHWMMGSTLGILCAGYLLVANVAEFHLLEGSPASTARLIFLIAAVLFVGIGATLTGALFVVIGDANG
jgi:hypothetical protein